MPKRPRRNCRGCKRQAIRRSRKKGPQPSWLRALFVCTLLPNLLSRPACSLFLNLPHRLPIFAELLFACFGQLHRGARGFSKQGLFDGDETGVVQPRELHREISLAESGCGLQKSEVGARAGREHGEYCQSRRFVNDSVNFRKTGLIFRHRLPRIPERADSSAAGDRLGPKRAGQRIG